MNFRSYSNFYTVSQIVITHWALYLKKKKIYTTASFVNNGTFDLCCVKMFVLKILFTRAWTINNSLGKRITLKIKNAFCWNKKKQIVSKKYSRINQICATVRIENDPIDPSHMFIGHLKWLKECTSDQPQYRDAGDSKNVAFT